MRVLLALILLSCASELDFNNKARELCKGKDVSGIVFVDKNYQYTCEVKK